MHTSVPFLEISLTENTYNKADALRYIHNQFRYLDLMSYVRETGGTDEGFAETLYDKSEGNFMYLKHVMPEKKRASCTKLPSTNSPTVFWNSTESTGGA